MKLAITVNTATPDTALEPRFGRTPYFAICDLENNDQLTFVENVATQEAHGAGVMAAQILIDNNAEAIVCAKYGPNGSQALNQAGIACYLFGAETSIEGVVESYKNGSLKTFSA